MKRLRTISVVLIAAACAGLLLQCGSPSDLFGSVEERVAKAQSGEITPVAPSHLVTTVKSSSQIDLTWSDNSDNEEEFQIYRDSGSGFQGIDTVGADSTAYSDQGLTVDTSYTYRVRASNSAGESAWTHEVGATTCPPPTDPPEAPSDLSATTQDSDQINLSWSDKSDNEEFFELQRKKGSGGTFMTVDNNIESGITGYQNTELDSETDYYYRVRAGNSAGTSNWSNEANDITDQLVGPIGLTATAVSDKRIELSWKDNSVGEDYYEIQRYSDSGFEMINTIPEDSQSGGDYNLDAETQYTYRVRSCDAGGNSPWSTEVSVTTGPPPGTAENFTASDISWTMRYVPAKSLPTKYDDTGSVTVSNDFWPAETEVTYELWYVVYTWATSGSSGTGAGQYNFANTGIPGHDGTAGTEITSQEPVTTINWRDAMVWCNALTEWYNAQKGTSYTTVYNDNGTPIRDSRDSNDTQCDSVISDETATGFRLLTSEEWELAARYIDDVNSDGDIEDANEYFDEYYPGNYASGADAKYDAVSVSQDLDGDGDSNITDEVGWYNGNSGSSTHNVATRDDNALGFYDMTGNVEEWCFTPSGSSHRLFRGGCWSDLAHFVQLGLVGSNEPFWEDEAVGFRFARSDQ